jgi:hypothetical protein
LGLARYSPWVRRVTASDSSYASIPGRPPIFSRQESLKSFSSPQPGAEKQRSGNFETPAAQKRRRHGIQRERHTTLFSEEFERDFSIINYVARPTLIA